MSTSITEAQVEAAGLAIYRRRHAGDPMWPVGVNKAGRHQEPYVAFIPDWKWKGYEEDARAALAAALSTEPGEAEGKPRQVLFFASYCGNDNTACSDVRPCPTCLGMSNVYEIPAGTPIKYLRQLSPDWLNSKKLEGLTAREIGKAPKAAAPLPEDTHHG